MAMHGPCMAMQRLLQTELPELHVHFTDGQAQQSRPYETLTESCSKFSLNLDLMSNDTHKNLNCLGSALEFWRHVEELKFYRF